MEPLDHGLIPGHARNVLPANTNRAISERKTVFEAMLTGYETSLIAAQRHTPASLAQYLHTVRQFCAESDRYPWEWQPADLDQWTRSKAESGLARSTIRLYHQRIASFDRYATHSAYGWIDLCQNRFGSHPVQIVYPFNTATHLTDREGRPGRRPLSPQEVDDFFAAADARVDTAAQRGRKGVLTSLRDSILMRCLYGFGFRCNEVTYIDTVDWRRNTTAPEFGDFGGVSVRYGKGLFGSGPRERYVFSVWPEISQDISDYVTEIRPLFETRHENKNAMFLTERGTRLSSRRVSDIFSVIRAEAGLPKDLSAHSLRHTYATELTEAGFPPDFVRRQLGHSNLSTTTAYTQTGDDFMQQMVRRNTNRLIEDSRDD